jgi:hypothetical protein
VSGGTFPSHLIDEGLPACLEYYYYSYYISALPRGLILVPVRPALQVGMATQLVPLQEVERLSANVIRILAGNPGKVCRKIPTYYISGAWVFVPWCI